MQVTADTLVKIANKLVELEKLDIQITEFELNGNIISVSSTDTQTSGRTYYLHDINPKRPR